MLIRAIVAGVIGVRQIKQKREADNRAEWWKRTQWALDAVYSGDDRRATVGLKVLTVLAASDLAGQGELDVLVAAWENPLDEAEQDLKAADEETASSGTTERTALFGEVRSASEAIKGVQESAHSVTDPAPGVDDEPGPRDNGVNDQQDPLDGGTR